MGMWHATNDAIASAKEAKQLTESDEGAIELLLRLAERLDDPDFPMIGGRFDNVSESLYLKTCEQLGLTPAGRVRLGQKREAGRGKLGQLRDTETGRTKRARTG